MRLSFLWRTLPILLLSASAAFAQTSQSITLAWTNPTVQSPADHIEIRYSSVLSSPPPLWPILSVTNVWTVNGALPPGNAVFVLWLQTTNGWSRVSSDIETGRFYTNSVTLRNTQQLFVNPFQNQFFIARFTMDNGAPPSDFSNACQWQASPTNTILWVSP